MKKILQLTEAIITAAEKIEPRTPDVSVLIGGLHTARDQAQKIIALSEAPKVAAPAASNEQPATP